MDEEGKVPKELVELDYMVRASVGAAKCRACRTPLPADALVTRRYCDPACRAKFHRMKKDKRARDPLGIVRTGDEDPEIFTIAKMMAIENLDDEIRTVIRDEVRKSITKSVQDKMLGATEIMAEMLPIALARLAQDMGSKDWVRSHRAQGLFFKYMSQNVVTANPEEEQSRTINLIVNQDPNTALSVHNVPATPLGQEFITASTELTPEIKYDGDGNVVEGFELGDIETLFPIRFVAEQFSQEFDEDAHLGRHEFAAGVDGINANRRGATEFRQDHLEIAALEFVGDVPGRAQADAQARQERLAHELARIGADIALDLDGFLSVRPVETPALLRIRGETVVEFE